MPRPCCAALIDAGDYKQYIFPLLFLKRLSDVYDEEYAEALAESGGDETYAALPETAPLPDPRRLPLVDICVRPAATSAARSSAACEPSSRRTRACPACSATHPGPTRNACPTRPCSDLIEHFSQITLSIANVPEDELGNGYEYLIKKFADDSGHTAPEFYTNRTLVHLMTQMLEHRARRVGLRPHLRHRRHADLRRQPS